VNAGDNTALDGGCTCGQVRYRLQVRPMLVHCCHCRWCQRETGSAFVLNALVERDQLRVLQGDTATVPVPTHSGKGQKVVRCAQCQVALWSHYPGGGEAIAFVRVGTLDTPAAMPPDVHIYTASRQPWLVLPEGVPAFAEFYDPRAFWPPQALQRYRDAQQRAVGAPA
jgi:hypothetical protein